MPIASPAQMAALYERYDPNPTDVWQKPEEVEKEWLERIRGGAEFTIPGATKEVFRGPKEGQSEADWKRRWYSNQCVNRGKMGESKPVVHGHLPTPSPPSPCVDTGSALPSPPRNPASRTPRRKSTLDHDSDDNLVQVIATRQNAWKSEKKDMQSKLDELAANNTYLEEKNKALQQELDELRRPHAEKQGRLNEMKTSLDARTKALDERESTSRKEADEAKRLEMAKEKSLQEWEASLNVLEEEAKEKSEHVADLQRQLMATRNEKESTQWQLRETLAQKARLSRQLQDHSRELDAERQKLETTRDKLTGVQSERADLKEQNDRLNSTMEATIDNYKILFDGLTTLFATALDDFKRNDSPNARGSMIQTCQRLHNQMNVISNNLASTSTRQSTADEDGQRSPKRARTE
ncbi:hypothetical protein Moror_4187 [Moniliophthora roreri MCA 2997]|uniref:Uncharacterized protein n=2 Tax=Moniliophthora roreri TaxID=221103 RepID=V2WUW4_MONRO|nr:hypothetical protein Moror_4187 [Moniliophthora roreri MCA 2997]KAI3597468.1 hypothetical protein WG66_013224 [Moniliophthora roreri]